MGALDRARATGDVSKEFYALRSAVANGTRWFGADAPEVCDLRRELQFITYARRFQLVIDSAPRPLTPRERERLSDILSSVIGTRRDTSDGV